MADNQNEIFVSKYTKDDGTDVKSHYRSKPGNANSIKQNTPTGAASNLDNMTTSEKLQSWLYEDVLKEALPKSSNFTEDAMHDFRQARENPNAKVLNNLNQVNDRALYDKMINKLGIPDNSRGVMYDQNSNVALDVANSVELNNFIEQNYEDLKNNKIDNASIGFDFGNNVDNYASMQHITLHKPSIDRNGNFSATGVDYYDFSNRNNTNSINIPNNWGYNMQEKGNLENYFILIDIKNKVNK